MTCEWRIVGFHRPVNSDHFLQPVFKNKKDKNCYIQFSFSRNSELSDIVVFANEYVPCIFDGLDFDPTKGIILGDIIEGSPRFYYRRDAKEYILGIELDRWSDGDVIQICDIVDLNKFGARDLHRIGRVISHEGDATFDKSSSSQAFIDAAVSEIRSDADLKEAVSNIISSAKWVINWTVADIPGERWREVSCSLRVGANEIETILISERDRMRALAKRALVSEGDVALRFRAKSIAGMARQELRISELLALIIDEPSTSVDVISGYERLTKYEEVVVPMIEKLAKSVRKDSHEIREFSVANLIPKIFVKYFPVRRGRFMIDLLDRFKYYPVVYDQLIRIFYQKKHTYGFKIYDESLKMRVGNLDKR